MSACRTDGFYSSGNMYMPSGGSDVGTYGMQTCGLLPSFGKRGEVNHQNMGMNVHPYISHIDNWTEPSRPCRTESPSHMSNYTFPQSIKEESDCCMFSDKRVQKVASPQLPSYANIPESCSLDGPEIPVPGYFRLSQAYANGKQQDGYCPEPPSSSPTLLQLSRVTPKPQSTDRKSEDLAHETDPPCTPNPAESPEPDCDSVERLCSVDASASSPEPLQQEGKGRKARGGSFYLVALQ